MSKPPLRHSSPPRRHPRRAKAHFTVGRLKVPVLYPMVALEYGAFGDQMASATITFTIHGRDAARVYAALTKGC